MPGHCDTGTTASSAPKLHANCSASAGCTYCPLTRISTRCSQAGLGLAIPDDPLPEVTHSHRIMQMGGKNLDQRSSASQGQRPGPTQAPQPALAVACFLPGRGHLLPRGHSPLSSPQICPQHRGANPIIPSSVLFGLRERKHISSA